MSNIPGRFSEFAGSAKAGKIGSYGTIKIAGGDTATPINLRKRIKIILPWLQAGGRFLDCGCGAGEYVRELCVQHQVDAQGIEYLAEKIAQAQNDPLIANRVRQGNIEQLPFANAIFDAALLNEVLEHVPDENRALSEIRRVLKPSGVLVVFSPNRLHPFETHGTRLKNGVKIPHYVPGVPYIPLSIGGLFLNYWARNYWPGELARLAVRNGFSILAKQCAWQTFENISGNQPRCLQPVVPLLRGIANCC